MLLHFVEHQSFFFLLQEMYKVCFVRCDRVLVTHPANLRKRTGRSGMVARKPRRRRQERGVNARDCLSFIPSHNVISVVCQDADISQFQAMYNDSTLYCWTSFRNIFCKDDWLKIVVYTCVCIVNKHTLDEH